MKTILIFIGYFRYHEFCIMIFFVKFVSESKIKQLLPDLTLTELTQTYLSESE